LRRAKAAKKTEGKNFFPSPPARPPREIQPLQSTWGQTPNRFDRPQPLLSAFRFSLSAFPHERPPLRRHRAARPLLSESFPDCRQPFAVASEPSADVSESFADVSEPSADYRESLPVLWQ